MDERPSIKNIRLEDKYKFVVAKLVRDRVGHLHEPSGIFMNPTDKESIATIYNNIGEAETAISNLKPEHAEGCYPQSFTVHIQPATMTMKSEKHFGIDPFKR